MNAKLNLKKILPLSLLVGLVIFVIKNLITYTLFKHTIVDSLAIMDLNFIILSAYLFFYYYIHAFTAFSIFVYIRNSLPIESKKAGLVFALISFLFGNTIYSVWKLAAELSIDLNVVPKKTLLLYASESISGIISLILISLFISYIFEKFYKKGSENIKV